MYWLDYSAAKLPGATIKAAGYGGVIRYIDAPDRLRTKHTNLDEYRDHVANGLAVRLVMQNTTTDADGGYNAGVANAQRAKAGADYLGYTGVIFFANDRTTVPNPAAWTAYLDGASSVLGLARVGAYGFFNALNLAQGHASAFWQAGRRSDLVGQANFWQDNNTQVTVGGVVCDRNLVIADYNPEDDMPTPADLINAELIPNQVYPGKLDSLATMVGWTNWEAHQANVALAQLAAAIGKLNGVTAGDLAAALLPGLADVVKAQLADVAGLDENAVAAKLADVLAARLAQ